MNGSLNHHVYLGNVNAIKAVGNLLTCFTFFLPICLLLSPYLECNYSLNIKRIDNRMNIANFMLVALLGVWNGLLSVLTGGRDKQ